MSQILGRLARGQHNRMLADALLREAGAQRGKVMTRDGLVGDDYRLTAPHQRQDFGAGAGDQAGADQDVVAAIAEFDAQLFDFSGFRGFRRHGPVSAPAGVNAR